MQVKDTKTACGMAVIGLSALIASMTRALKTDSKELAVI